MEIKTTKQIDLFNNIVEEDWKKEWNDMPEFVQEKQEPYAKIIFRFECEDDLKEFAELIGQKLNKKTKSAWYPFKSHWGNCLKEYNGENLNPKYPIYIISKGRGNNCLTARELKKMNVPFRLVIEPQEYEQYKHITENILLLPFSNLGQGSISARNWVWEHSINEGHKWHWILDDNIEGFHRLNKNKKPKTTTGDIFRYAEDFVDRYDNIAQAGFNYYSFCKKTDKIPAFYLNTRIYSCILIRNDIPFRWIGKYNEDTDLSIRVLKDGWCTVLFNAFLCGKVTTMRMKGGNTDTIYNQTDNRLEFAKSLAEQHPDIVKVTKKFGRWHHQVDYSGFKSNKLIKKETVRGFTSNPSDLTFVSQKGINRNSDITQN